MYRKIFLILLTLLVFFTTAKLTTAQQVTSYPAYLTSLESYRSAENQYELKRSEYLKFGTLSSKNDAISATKNFLIATDNVWISYFTVLTESLREKDLTINEEIKNQNAQKIEDEALFFEAQKNETESASELEKLVEISRITQERVLSTESISFIAVGEIKIAKLEFQKTIIQDIINDLETKIGSIEEKGDKDTALARRWLTDAKSELASYQQNINTAKEVLAEIESKTSQASKRSTFEKMQTSLNSAKMNLDRSNKFLSEILKEIKTAD